MSTDNVCPECGHVFQGDGWEGIVAHWRAKHEVNGMRYEDAWPLIATGRYNRPMRELIEMTDRNRMSHWSRFYGE